MLGKKFLIHAQILSLVCTLATALLIGAGLLSACSPQHVSLPYLTPTPTVTGLLAFSPQDYLISRVGQQYYGDHYRLVEQTPVNQGVTKVLFLFSYPPLVEDYPLTLFYDTRNGGLAPDQISTILLEPQTFRINQDEAINHALQAGLAAASSYQIHIIIGPQTQNRFAWHIENPTAGSGALSSVILDIENGQVYATGIAGPLQAQ